MKEFPDFDRKKDCDPKKNMEYVKDRQKIATIILFMLVFGSLVPLVLYNGMETTLIFENDITLGGVIEVGRILQRSELPQTPIPICLDGSDIIYGSVDNITTAWISLIGFIICEKPLLDVISENITLFMEFHLFLMYMANGIYNHSYLDFRIEDLAINEYLTLYPPIFVIGNYENEDVFPIHRTIFKFTARQYVIPFFEIIFSLVTLSYRYVASHYGIWTRALEEPELAYMKVGTWKITPIDFEYDATSALFMVTRNMSLFPYLTRPAVYTDCDISRSFDIRSAFIPITRYEKVE